MIQILFRCDSSYKLGSGHLVRCLNLANQLNGEITFICRKLPGNINSKVIENQFKLLEIDSSEYEIEQNIDELEEIIPIISSVKADIIIVDHYGLNFSWEIAASKHCKKLIAIDDIGRFHHANSIIDQNLYYDIPENYIRSKSNLYIGPTFALMNNNFLNLPTIQRKIDSITEILVFFGGSDIDGLTVQIMDIIHELPAYLIWNIVIGSQNISKEYIFNKYSNYANINLYQSISNMQDIMLRSDLCIGAGGITSWERAKTGLPAIVYSVSNNQISICQNLHSKKCIIYLGNTQLFSVHKLKKAINSLTTNIKLLKTMSNNNLKLNVSSKLNFLVNEILSI
jgi:UDP-2,4-diacetamido-2,4,6-trideoxy-beta-L-altropyranose hydrolase